MTRLVQSSAKGKTRRRKKREENEILKTRGVERLAEGKEGERRGE